MKASSLNWLKIAAKDLKLAKLSLDGSEPLGVIYHLHACLEKTLKGIAEENDISPPRIHSLKKLAIDTCNLKLTTHNQVLISSLDKAYIDSRYPEDVVIFEEEYDLENCSKLYTEV